MKPLDRDKLGKVPAMSTSSHDDEVLVAVQLTGRMLKEIGIVCLELIAGGGGSSSKSACIVSHFDHRGFAQSLFEFACSVEGLTEQLASVRRRL